MVNLKCRFLVQMDHRPMAHLYLTDDTCQPFAARIFTLDRFVCHSVRDDEENLGEVGVVWSKDNGVVAVERRQQSAKKTHIPLQHLRDQIRRRRPHLSMRSHRKSNVWTASSLSSLSGSQLSQWGRISLTFTHSGRNLMTFPTAEMQFSVALTFSFERESAAWMTPTSMGMASGSRKTRDTSS